MRLPQILPLTTALLLTSVPRAHADAPTTDATTHAQHLYEAGQKATEEDDWQRARSFFASAFAVAPHYQIAANLARTEYKIGRMRDAAEHFAYCLRNAPRELPDADRQLIKNMFNNAKSRVGALTLASLPEGAEVLVDGVLVGKVPLDGAIFVEPGEHVIEARLHGYAPGRTTRLLAAGEEMTISLPLEELPRPGTKKKDATPTETTTVRHGVPPWVVASGLLAGIAANAGVALAISSQHFASQIAIEAPGCPDDCPPQDAVRYNALNPARVDFANASFWVLGAAGALGIATVIGAFTGTGSDSSPARVGKVQLVVGGSGAWVKGTF